MALSKRKQAFVEHYLQCWNAAEAARRAGYSERSARQQASRLMTKADVQAYIDARLAELKITADEVLTRLTDHARGSMSDFVDVSSLGVPKLNFSPTRMHLVKKLVIRPGEFGTTIEFELYDAQAALAIMARHHSLLKDRTALEAGDKPLLFNILPVSSMVSSPPDNDSSGSAEPDAVG